MPAENPMEKGIDTRDRAQAIPSWNLITAEKTHIRRESSKEPWRARVFHALPYFLRPGRMDKTLQCRKPSALRPSELVFPPLWALPLGFEGLWDLERGHEVLGIYSLTNITIFLQWGSGRSGKLNPLLSQGHWFSEWRKNSLIQARGIFFFFFNSSTWPLPITISLLGRESVLTTWASSGRSIIIRTLKKNPQSIFLLLNVCPGKA